MWFWFSLAALLCWSGSDVFSKLGCRYADDKYGSLKMVTAVGAVMGMHAFYTVFVSGVSVTAADMLKYLPVSACYILSMALGYAGHRYIELSILSPICNSSGAIVALLCIIRGDKLALPQLIAVALVCAGVIGLGVADMREDDDLRKKRQSISNYKYAKSAAAIALPLAYCLIDAVGTFADSIILETLDEDAANSAYEFTFLVCGIVSFIYVKFIKKQKFIAKREAPKYAGAVFETAGQFAYIYALADETHVALTVPVISAYCLASVLWGRIFLKEKLSLKHYITILIAAVGIVILGIYDI